MGLFRIRPALAPLAATAVLTAAPALAACPPMGAQVFSCTVKQGARLLEVCLDDGAAKYSYGAPGAAPELALSTLLVDLPYTPWSGVGATIWEEVSFSNGDVSYGVWYQAERGAEAASGAGGISGGVQVTQGDKVLADLSCDPGSVRADFAELSEAVEAVSH